MPSDPNIITPPRQTKWYGWKPDLPDQRDIHFKTATVKLPKRVTLQDDPRTPPIYDQGNLGSCTANGIAAALKFHRPDFPGQPSRLFIYYNERVREGSVEEDAGAYIRDGMSSLRKQGACSETTWAYSDNETLFRTRPSELAFSEGRQHREIGYQRVDQRLYSLRYAIAKQRPVVFGFTVYESFESQAVESSGIVPMPSQNEYVLGGHCVCAWGYDETHFLCRNSWGPEWGMQGYFLMPVDYLVNTDLAADFWVITIH